MRLGLMQTFDHSKSLEEELPPLGLGYLSSYLKKFADFHDIVYEKTPEDLVAHKPTLIGVSSVTQYYTMAIEQAREMKRQTGAAMIVGGGHITCLPDSLDPVFDVGVIGEGEDTMLELFELHRTGRWGAEHFRNVAGICYHDEDGKVRRNGARPPIRPMDKVPPPDRELLGDRWTIPFSQFVSIVSSRGCPFDCMFCSSQKHFEGPTRYFSAEYVVREIEEVLDRWSPASIAFWDDLFIAQPTRLTEISHLVAERGLDKRVSFTCSTRANIVNEKKCEDMRRMNVIAVNFGAESGSDHVLRYLKGGNVSVEQNQKAIDLFNKYGINVACSFITGSPAERPEDAQATLDFVRRNRDKLIGAEFYPVVAYPGTQMWNEAVAAGKIPMPVADWGQFSLSVSGNAEEFWSKYIYLNEQMPVETYKMYFYQMQEESLQLALKKTTRRIRHLEEALRQEWKRAEADRRFRNRRGVKALEKLLGFKDRVLAPLHRGRNGAQGKAAASGQRPHKVTMGSAFNCG